ncbi:PspA/IM30 family protein [Lewinella sp. LCG006]|uniref:PspA/IM30 family protein n=1 Tax=Lewinella sp. LCG006 TaxID=3231911 RepID=UPI0034603831
MSTEMPNMGKEKSFWKRPEGVTGLIFLAALVAGAGYVISVVNWPLIFANTLYLAGTLAVVGVVAYMVLDPKMRNLIGYAYKSFMRGLTGMFVNIDPIGILKSYIEDLENNLVKMRTQIGKLRGQMRQMLSLIEGNEAEINKQMKLASAAKDKNMDQQMVLSSRKAARLKESNEKYRVLHQRMEVMSRILNKMHDNSEILLEDTKDQVKLKEQERKAIRASHSAMQSAMSIISGDPDKRAMFDMAMEAVAEDVASKVGEMERFMEMSANFMDSVDLQNGVFEEDGLRMLEQWEQQSTLMLLGEGQRKSNTLDLDSAPSQLAEGQERSNKSAEGYDNLFK